MYTIAILSEEDYSVNEVLCEGVENLKFMVNLLEKSKIEYLVYNAPFSILKPSNLGWGDYHHWKCDDGLYMFVEERNKKLLADLVIY